MSEPETAARVRNLLETVLGRPVIPGWDICREEEPRWDSLKHMELIFLVEESFNVTFSEQELGELDSLSKIVSRIADGDAS